MNAILLTGATGFVGSRLHPRLAGRGLDVRCLTRDANAARRRHPQWNWVEGNIGDETAMRLVLEGCTAAYYLVHEMGSPGDFGAREAAAATAFARAAAAAGVQRIIYLGGVAPREAEPSEHLHSRIRVGQILMEGHVPTLELRASMIIGRGSLSFLIVRDLAARLALMILPRWLDSRTEPVAVDDVLLALERALDVPLGESCSLDLPGPEALSGREILLRTADALGLRRPLVIRVPVLTPRLSSHWVRFVTRAPWRVAREIVVGLTTDLLARDRRFWEMLGNPSLLPYSEAAERAVAEEPDPASERGPWFLVERLRRRLSRRSRI